MHHFVDSIHEVSSKETVPGKGLVIFLLEAVNMYRPLFHSPSERLVGSKVFSFHPYELSCDVMELLGRGYHIEPLLQEIPGFVLGQPVLDYVKEGFHPDCAFLSILMYVQ